MTASVRATRNLLVHALVVVAFAALMAPRVEAQGMLDRLKKGAQKKIEDKIDGKDDKKKDEKKDASTTKDDSSKEATPQGDVAAASADNTVFVNFDFVPGERVIVSEDFSKDNLGDFPRRFELESGNFEVAKMGETRVLRGTNFGAFMIPLPEALPQRFTIEFEFQGSSGWYQELRFRPENTESYVSVRPGDGGLQGPIVSNSQVKGHDRESKAMIPVRIMADGRYVKVYMAGTRVANVPNAQISRSKALWVHVSASESEPVLLSNFRIAAGGKSLYDAIAEKGRVATQGIFFDTGSDHIRPESAPTLRQIADMLGEHPELKLTIEGHTDNVGDAAANKTLSEKRAAAVKSALVSQHGVSADRLTTTGFGASKPSAPNTTPEGRQNNRRVELVKS